MILALLDVGTVRGKSKMLSDTAPVYVLYV